MVNEDQGRQPNSELLWREYESCRDTAQHLESIIWQTSGAIGIGSIGTFLLISNRPSQEQPPWFIAALIGFLVIITTVIWWLMARRWWSIQHSYFLRMQHIEKKLGLYATRYLQYLDNPYTLPKNDLTEDELDDLKSRAKKRGWFAPHQRMGIQPVLWILPFITFAVWCTYIVWLAYPH